MSTNSNQSNTGFWVVILIAAIGGIGYWYYTTKIQNSNAIKTGKILGLF
jgi:hypothetical protein